MSSRKIYRVRKTGATVSFHGVEFPSRYATVNAVKKQMRMGTWYLATQRGVPFAEFASEAELDQWWQFFQEHRNHQQQQKRATPIAKTSNQAKICKKLSQSDTNLNVYFDTKNAFKSSNLKDFD